MSSNKTPDANHARILDYWVRRRHGLTVPEWEEFYKLVFPILMRTQLPAEYRDASKRKDLVDLFFEDKIFLNAASSKAGPLTNVYALHGYLKNFEIDERRRAGTGDTDEEAEEGEGIGQQARAGGLESLPHARILADAGIDTAQAMRSADRFIEDLPPGEADFLRFNSCADDEETEPMTSIANRWAMGTTYHYKARALGITRSKGETYKGYEKTKIGRWLISTGAKLNADWREEIAVLLILLCQRVHIQYREAA